MYPFFNYTFANAISETVHWLFSVEYYTVVTQFTLVRVTAEPNSDQNEIDANAKRTKTTIKVVSGIFYTLVIACAILGEYYFLDSSDPVALYNAWIFSDAFLKLLSGFLILYSLLKFKALVKRMR